MSLKLPHTLLEDELADDLYLFEQLEEAISDGALPPCYHEHPVVENSDCPVLPIALYMDAVPYSLVDSA
eukprot:1974865-Pyramimonas_sp.AAC.1